MPSATTDIANISGRRRRRRLAVGSRISPCKPRPTSMTPSAAGVGSEAPKVNAEPPAPPADRMPTAPAATRKAVVSSTPAQRLAPARDQAISSVAVQAANRVSPSVRPPSEWPPGSSPTRPGKEMSSTSVTAHSTLTTANIRPSLRQRNSRNNSAVEHSTKAAEARDDMPSGVAIGHQEGICCANNAARPSRIASTARVAAAPRGMRGWTRVSDNSAISQFVLPHVPTHSRTRAGGQRHRNSAPTASRPRQI